MIKSITATLLGASVGLWLVGCTTTPAPNGGPAPVVDKSSFSGEQRQLARNAAQMPTDSNVEVTALEPLTPLDSPDQLAFNDADPQPIRRPKQEPSPLPETQPDTRNPAVVALLDNAATHLDNSDLDKAANALERALNIEPQAADIWHDLGQIRLAQQRYEDAEAMFSRSNDFATGDRSLQGRNWRKIGEARRYMGNTDGADEADAQAVLLGY